MEAWPGPRSGRARPSTAAATSFANLQRVGRACRAAPSRGRHRDASSCRMSTRSSACVPAPGRSLAERVCASRARPRPGEWQPQYPGGAARPVREGHGRGVRPGTRRCSAYESGDLIRVRSTPSPRTPCMWWSSTCSSTAAMISMPYRASSSTRPCEGLIRAAPTFPRKIQPATYAWTADPVVIEHLKKRMTCYGSHAADQFVQDSTLLKRLWNDWVNTIGFFGANNEHLDGRPRPAGAGVQEDGAGHA